MYRNIICKVETKTTETQNYEIPANVYTLMARLKAEYSSLNSNREYYLQQLEFNRKSSGMMNELLARVDVQLQFINFINNEFKELEPITIHIDSEEERLREYLKENRKARKKELLTQFPTLTCIRNMRLSEIKERFGSHQASGV